MERGVSVSWLKVVKVIMIVVRVIVGLAKDKNGREFLNSLQFEEDNNEIS